MSTNFRILASILYIGLQEYDWAINGLVARAKSTLAASAIVLGVMIAGVGGFAWLLSSGDVAGAIMAHLRSIQALWAVLAIGASSFGFMLGAACLSAWALRAVRVKSPFSSRTIMSNGEIDEGVMEAWAEASEGALYKNICKSYAAALKNREETVNSMGTKAILGQVFLAVGLSLTTVVGIVMLAAMGSVIGA